MQHKYDLDTPCLALDLEVLEQNLLKMQSIVQNAGKHIRPHAKTHKCSVLAKKQIQSGALGVCAAKVSEAEGLVKAGVEGILITGPVVTPAKIERLVELVSRSSSLMVVVDHPRAVDLLNDALHAKQLSMDVLVDMDVGGHRTGVLPENALELARHVNSRENLTLKGIQAYAGQVQHIASYEDRRKQSHASLQPAVDIFRKLREENNTCTIFSGAGTGTFDIDLAIPELTELQVGSYVLMDAEYLAVGSEEDGDRFTAFQPPLSLLTTVVSVNQEHLVTVDAGLKALYKHGGCPAVVNPEYAGLQYDWFGDEYGKLIRTDSSKLPELGTVLELIASHCDPTVNMFDCFYVTKADQVIETWPIDLRGKSQ